MSNDIVIWLPANVSALSCEEASCLFPLETGGAFMGYWNGNNEVVVTASISAGPNAIHERYSFEPDYKWQQQAIEDHYAASGRRETYLGDWHTHPGGITGRLSWHDKNVLRKIARSQTARAPQPLMLIYYGNSESWQVEAWCARIKSRKLLWPRLLVSLASLRLYE